MAMQILSEILRYAMEHRVIMEDDLYSTEPEIIRKLLSEERTAFLWNQFCAYSRITKAPRPGARGCWRKIAVKKRYIDPDMNLGDLLEYKANKKSKKTKNVCKPLYLDSDGINYFSGTNECVDFNYVWYSGKLWRITAIYPDGTLKMIAIK